jgi:hypothetical protein
VISFIDKNEEKSLTAELKIQATEYQEAVKQFPDCGAAFKTINEWVDKKPILFENYVNWARTKDKNAHQKNLAVIRMTLPKLFPNATEFENVEAELASVNSLQEELGDIRTENYLNDDDRSMLKNLIDKLRESIANRYDELLIEKYSHRLVCFTQQSYKKATELNTPVKTKPGTTGFFEFSTNRMALYKAAEMVLSSTLCPPVTSREQFGILEDKGKIYLQTERSIFRLNQSETRHFGLAQGVTATSLNGLLAAIKRLAQKPCSTDDPDTVLELNNQANSGSITSLLKLIGIRRTPVTEDNQPYKPSDGEAAMLVLQKVFRQEADAFVIDEPELSMGNSYINDVIRVNLQNLGKRQKLVLIATHNANLAVRTKPYLSVLRTYEGNDCYRTFTGNPFTDLLVNIEGGNDAKVWSAESMRILEGGREAFYDRRDVYESGSN